MAVAFTQTRAPTDTNGVASSGGISTYSTVAIGTASADRIVLLGVVTEAASATINSATIDYGGGAVAMKGGTAGVIGSQNVQLFWLDAPTGTTATFAITFGAAVTGGAGGTNNICVYAVTGASVNYFALGAVNDTDADPITTGAITVPTDGGLFVICNHATDSTARTLTGVTEDIDADAGAMRMATGTAGAGSITATVSGANGEDGTLSYIVFLPTPVNFGDISGVGSFGSITITNPLVLDRSIKVAVGDLVFVLFNEAASNTLGTLTTDNLGNSYTALNTLTPGSGIVKTYYSIVTVAGDCLPSISATAGASDSIVLAGSFKGPFAASTLDVNTTEVDDNAEPYTATGTGTLAQADELIIGYFASTVGASPGVYDTPAPSATIVAQHFDAALGSNACLTTLTVAATTTIAMAISDSIGNRSNACAAATFKKGSTAKTLTADSGTFNFTGTASTLKVGHKLPAGSGAFAFTGTAATLRKSIPLVAGSGSFSFSGQTATLKIGHKLPAGSGTFNFTGTAANLKVGHKVIAGSGAFNFTGTAATFRRTYKLVAASGAFNFSGTAATLLHKWKLVADSGSFSFSGSDATLKVGHKLTAESGTFNFTGSDVSLRHNYRLTAESGSFNFTGTDATLTVTSVGAITLPADSGSFVFTGTDAATLHSYRLIAEPAGSPDPFTVLLLHMDGADGSTTFTDATGRHTIAVSGNAQIDTAQSAFGGASALFDGAGDYVEASGDTDFAYGTSDFTIDCRIRANDVVARVIFSGTDATGINPAVYFDGSGNIRYRVSGSDQINGGAAVSAGTWTHIALARASGTTKLFVDGTQVGSDFADTFDFQVNDVNIGIGGDQSFGPLDGWIDEFRILKGVAAWTANFTPPTAPYSASTPSFIFSGSDATVTKSAVRTLTADSGAFNFSGSDAALKVGHRLIAESGAFNFTGSDANLLHGWRLIAESGAFNFTGSDVSFKIDYRLIAESGAWNFTGSDATLTVTAVNKVLAAESGSFLFTGSPAGLIYVPVSPVTVPELPLPGGAGAPVRKPPAGPYAPAFGRRKPTELSDLFPPEQLPELPEQLPELPETAKEKPKLGPSPLPLVADFGLGPVKLGMTLPLGYQLAQAIEADDEDAIIATLLALDLTD